MQVKFNLKTGLHIYAQDGFSFNIFSKSSKTGPIASYPRSSISFICSGLNL